MILSLTTTAPNARDLGFLLEKHPDRASTFGLAFGSCHVVWPEASDARATCALVLDLDPVALVRGRPDASGAGPLAQYVNDRPYVASSFLSVAIAAAFRSALNGRSRARPERLEEAWPFEVHLPVLPCRGGEGLLRRLFEPLGYTVTAERVPVAPEVLGPEAGSLWDVRLVTERRLAELLAHLYVLVPVLDDEKHYWVGDAEVEHLLARGEGWLSEHPERETIALRYLKRRRSLARDALARLTDAAEDDASAEEEATTEAALEAPLSLDEQRRRAVIEALRAADARSVADVGCGEGRLLRALLQDPFFTHILGLDVSPLALERAAARLHLDRLSERWASRITLAQGSLTWRDPRLDAVDAVACVEVIEHLDPDRLPDAEDALFAGARPPTVVMTTPNADYNALFPKLAAGAFRHGDHRFEWTRAEAAAWADRVATTHGYAVTITGIGEAHPELGSPTLLMVFTRCR